MVSIEKPKKYISEIHRVLSCPVKGVVSENITHGANFPESPPKRFGIQDRISGSYKHFIVIPSTIYEAEFDILEESDSKNGELQINDIFYKSFNKAKLNEPVKIKELTENSEIMIKIVEFEYNLDSNFNEQNINELQTAAD